MVDLLTKLNFKFSLTNMLYVKRTITPVFKRALSQFPSVLLTGPRQSGKTTLLLKEISEPRTYITFDDPLQRELAMGDPRGFLAAIKDFPVIFDEIQYVPQLFPYIKMHIDSNRTDSGKWILTGSQQFHLMKNVTESLAGRIALMDLLPFDFQEISSFAKRDLEDTLWNSSFPEPAIMPEKRDLWIRSYIQTYIERDIRQLINVRDVNFFNHFLVASAARHAQEFKKSVFSRQVGVSQPTIKKWMGILEASYLVFLLPPYFRNFGKRLVKSPKFYFLDSALVAYLTRQPDKSSLIAGPMGGALFEGWVVSETVKAFYNAGKRPDIYFWRSHDGMEVDLIVAIGGRYFPVEIKLTATPTLKHIDPLKKFIKLLPPEEAGNGLLVCKVEGPVNMAGNIKAIPWHDYPFWLKKQLASLG